MTTSQITAASATEAQPVQLRSTWLRATLGAMLVLIGMLAVRLFTVTPSEAAELRMVAVDTLGPGESPAVQASLPLVPVSTTR